MAWSERDHPEAMRNLPSNVRRKAIQVANVLAAAGDDEPRAVRLGIARAKKWAANPDRSGRPRKAGKTTGRRSRRVRQRGPKGIHLSKASRFGGRGPG